MRKFVSAFLAALFTLAPSLYAQDTTTLQSPSPQSGQTAPYNQGQNPGKTAVRHTPDGNPILEDGTPVRMRTKRNLSSAENKTGDQVDFEILDAVVLDGITVIPQGGLAFGKVTEAEPKKRMGRGGKLNVVIESVKMTNGEKAALRSVKENKGGGHVGAMTGAMVATGIIFFPAAPLFLFMHGKDITIPSGTEITAYVNSDTVFVPAATMAAPAAPTSAPAASASAELVLTSSPEGADIEIDGAFSGNTPSTLQVTPGDHTVRITQNGYAPYEKKVHISGGKITLRAQLETVKAQ